ncbi:MAG: Protein translocase membrane subunit SecG, partial [uncultured Sphingomonas sp.]
DCRCTRRNHPDAALGRRRPRGRRQLVGLHDRARCVGFPDSLDGHPRRHVHRLVDHPGGDRRRHPRAHQDRHLAVEHDGAGQGAATADKDARRPAAAGSVGPDGSPGAV